jgi:putative Holliday junction resolvase
MAESTPCCDLYVHLATPHPPLSVKRSAKRSAKSMTFVTANQLPALLQPGQRLLGLDIGSKTIGLALSDAGRSFASALRTHPRGKFPVDLAMLRQLVDQHQIGALIYGWPLTLDGGISPSCQRVQNFADLVAAQLPLPAVLWDERLSTAAVNRMLIDQADQSRQKRAAKVDALAAAWLLQGFLDCLSIARQRP